MVLAGPAVSYAEIARGSFLYHQNACRQCHFSSGVGGNVIHGGPSLIDDEWLHCDGSIEGITSVIIAGVPLEDRKNRDRDSAMDAAHVFGVSDQDAALIAKYLWVLGHMEDGSRGSSGGIR